MTTIVLADDHPLVRQGLRALLGAEPDFRVVGEAGDGAGAVRLAESLKPDVLVIDIMMPGLNGLEATREMKKRSPQTRVIILTMYGNEAYVIHAMGSGAMAYVLKEANSAEVVSAVREVVAGRRYLCSRLSQGAIDAYLKRSASSPVDLLETLSIREREVLQLAVEGYSNAEIGSRLMISPRTAETHRANLKRKLGLRTHSGLVSYAVGRGILPAASGPAAQEAVPEG